MDIVPFESWHLDAVDRQKGQESEPCGGAEYAGTAYTAMDDGVPVACAGFMRRHGKTFAWATLSELGPRRFIALHRAVCRHLDCQAGAVEAFVDCDFEAARRWMALLGFDFVNEIGGFMRYRRVN